MRNLLALAAAILLTVAVVGWYRGWYQVKTEPAADGHRQVTIDINAPKVGQDLQKGEDKVHDLLSKSTTPGGPTSGQLPPPPSTSPSTSGTAANGQGWNRPGDEASWVFPGQDQIPPPPGGQTRPAAH